MKSHGLEMKGVLGSSDGVDAIQFTDVTGEVTFLTDLEINGESKLDGTVKITGGAPLAGKVLYTTDVNGTLSWKYQSVPSGKTVLFEKDSSVTGYTMETDHDDGVVYITASESAFSPTWYTYWGDNVYWSDGVNCNYNSGQDRYEVAGPGAYIEEYGTWNVGFRPDKIRIEGYHEEVSSWDVKLRDNTNATIATISLSGSPGGDETVVPTGDGTSQWGTGGSGTGRWDRVNAGVATPDDSNSIYGTDGDVQQLNMANPSYGGTSTRLRVYARGYDSFGYGLTAEVYDGAVKLGNSNIGFWSGSYSSKYGDWINTSKTAAELSDLVVKLTGQNSSGETYISELEVEIEAAATYSWQTIEANISFGASDINDLDLGAPSVGYIRNIEFESAAVGTPGEEGGTNKSGGTWTQPSHDHGGSSAYTDYTRVTVAMMPSHRHAPAFGTYFIVSGNHVSSTGESGNDFYTQQYTTYTGGGGSHRHTLGSIDSGATVNTWRPYGRNLTRQTKN